MTFTDWRADQKEPSAIRPYILLDSAHGFQWNGRDNTDDNNNGYICKKKFEFSTKVDGQVISPIFGRLTRRTVWPPVFKSS